MMVLDLPVKKRSLVRSAGAALAWLAALVTGATGCVIEANDHPRWDDDPGVPPPSDPLLVTIDADKTIDAAPGEGVGLFVQYQAGGIWKVWTACDTLYSGVGCTFDACVEVEDASGDITAVRGEDIEADDRVATYGDGSTCLSAVTDYDIDAMTFTTAPGAIVRLTMALDGWSEPRYVFWVGDGALHEGAPTNPIDFAPSSP
jgi:hypothetical protein